MSNQAQTTTLYPRRCDATGKGMREGYCFHEGGYYACDETSAKAYVESLGYSWEEELSTLDKAIENEEDWFYWTEWDDELDKDEPAYDAEGFAYVFWEGKWIIDESEWEYEDTRELPGYDIYIHTPTGKRYSIPTEIIRFFDQKSEVKC